MDLDVLAAMQQRSSYERYARFVKPSSLSQEAYTILSAMGEWYDNNPQVEEINWRSFGAWFVLVRHAKMDKVKLQVLKDYIGILDTKEAGDDLKPLMEGLAKRDYAGKIAEVALRISDGDYGLTFDNITTLLAEYDKSVGKVDRLDDAIGGFTLEAMNKVSAPGLEWRMHCLREGLGDIRKGDLLLFGKRPDVGGTTFMASEVTYMAEQLPEDQHVIWFNNEEEGDKVRRRILQAACGWTSKKMEGDLKGAMSEYLHRMGSMDKIIVVDLPGMHVKDCERVLEKYNAGLIIFDQLWKVHGYEEEGEVMRQTLIANWGRELSKKHAPVMGVHQAGGEAEGQKWLNQGMLYGSKTGVQGEADAIVMMGRHPDTGNTRYIHIPKNKLQTPGNPALRNGKWEVEIVPDIARFKEYL